MATIPEELSSSSSGDWPRYPGLSNGYEDGRREAFRYRCRFSLCRKYGGLMAVVASVCAIVLFVVLLSLTGKNKQPAQQEADDVLDVPSTQQDDNVHMNPVWYDRSSVWDGSTYIDAEQFCSNIDERWPCPYSIYCPDGRGKSPLGGVHPSWSWAPIGNSQNEWVQLGRKGTCELRSDLGGPWGNPYGGDFEVTTAVACCLTSSSIGPEHLTPNPTTTTTAKADVSPVNNSSDLQTINSTTLTKKEQAALDNMRPLWFGRRDGYQGTTHEEAADFCDGVGGMHLCLAEAYCPNGSPKDEGANARPLFLQTRAFSDEQWAPLAYNPNSWMLIGTVDGDPGRTCHSYDALYNGTQPLWGLDGTAREIKQHVLCCKEDTDNDGSAEGGREGPIPTSSGVSRLGLNGRGYSLLLLVMVVAMKRYTC